MTEKKIQRGLNLKEFKNPPAQYRGAPFWAWNTTLEEQDLKWQIDKFKEMGFGGFFMHTRSGMATEYLGEEFMRLVRVCVAKAKSKGMLAYLYDEDRWSSGSAGGKVTKNKEYRQKTVCLSLKTPEEMQKLCEKDERCPEFLKAFDIVFDKSDRLESYKTLSVDEEAVGEKWYAYVLLARRSGWYNGYTYLDMLNSEAVSEFITVTHEAYKKEVGNEFGKTVPAIFTDEPNFGEIHPKAYARDGLDAEFPWTQRFATMFKDKYGYDISENLPELVWNLSGDKPSKVRYHYYAFTTELFALTYCDKVGEWCSDNNIDFVGHVLAEPELYSQMRTVGECMRHYKNLDIPGIDMLCNAVEFTTAKQAQSVAHQGGKKGMASELYGVTGWDFDFRGHKFQGDWQAALGVTFRIPHLSWVSMHGSAKRDYPASIGYQSCWYTQYSFIENHYARLNTALTRGKPVVNVAVIHPIESAWITSGVRELTSEEIKAMDERFGNLTNWLLRGHIDFDFVSESMLPDMYKKSEKGFNIGEMNYKAVFVPPLKTIRKTTVDALCEFIENGGKVVVSGNCPECVDGEISDYAARLYEIAENAVFSESDILNAFSDEREVEILNQSGGRKREMIYTLREDGENKWLFVAHCENITRLDGSDYAYDKLRINVKGIYKPTLYNTLNGEIEEVEFFHKNGETFISIDCFTLDSFLFFLTPCESETAGSVKFCTYLNEKQLSIPDFVDFEIKEPNVLVLDMAEYSRDGKTYFPREEILRIDKAVRDELEYPLANGCDTQPWCFPEKKPTEFVYLKFKIKSQTAVSCRLGYERFEDLWLNGVKLEKADEGYFTDKSIRTMRLPKLKKGENELIIRTAISERISIENYFLLGKFGVSVSASYAELTKPAKKLAFGSVVEQKLPFYGAEITYKIPFECEDGDLTVNADYYNGALIGVRIDGKDVGKIVLPPYEITIPNVKSGKHLLEMTLYASRINTFGALHLCVPVSWKGPNMWYTYGNGWAYEYQLKDVGIMKKPVLKLKKK